MTPIIHMDGKTLVGTTWVRPSDWQTSDIELDLLPGLKGASPDELPELGPPTDDTPLGRVPELTPDSQGTATLSRVSFGRIPL